MLQYFQDRKYCKYCFEHSQYLQYFHLQIPGICSENCSENRVFAQHLLRNGRTGGGFSLFYDFTFGDRTFYAGSPVPSRPLTPLSHHTHTACACTSTRQTTTEQLHAHAPQYVRERPRQTCRRAACDAQRTLGPRSPGPHTAPACEPMRRVARGGGARGGGARLPACGSRRPRRAQRGGDTRGGHERRRSCRSA